MKRTASQRIADALVILCGLLILCDLLLIVLSPALAYFRFQDPGSMTFDHLLETFRYDFDAGLGNLLAILLGFAYLVATRTIQATIPVTIVATVFVLTALNTGSAYTALIECMSGGLLFGAVFMATDYVTSPFTTKGKLFYGVFIGLITFLIRHFGSMNEGMSYAILLGNLMTPWFNAWGHQTPLGYKKPKKAKKGGAE